MKVLITGICGFVGSTLARAFLDHTPAIEVFGIDNFIRPGSEGNRAELKRRGATLFHADLRAASDLETLPAVDFVIDAAANPSVLAGVDGKSSSRQLIEHNLLGTVNLLEYCKAHRAGFALLSTSRVYAIEPLSQLKVDVVDRAFRPVANTTLRGFSADAGVAESFSCLAPISLYGSTKLASEALALEYGATFSLPVFINRCGVLAGAGQFGRADQGIFAYWINSYLQKRPLKYIGFGGEGFQVRDCLHPRDLAPLLLKQFANASCPLATEDRIINCSGGIASAMSLRQLSDWCAAEFGPHSVSADAQPRAFDIPWMVLDSARAQRLWQWAPSTSREAILQEIGRHARANPNWLEVSTGV